MAIHNGTTDVCSGTTYVSHRRTCALWGVLELLHLLARTFRPHTRTCTCAHASRVHMPHVYACLRFHDGLLAGVAAGLCTEADVSNALTNTFTLRFQLGLFDPAESQPFWHVPTTAIATQASQDLNMLATLSSLVLLQVCVVWIVWCVVCRVVCGVCCCFPSPLAWGGVLMPVKEILQLPAPHHPTLHSSRAAAICDVLHVRLRRRLVRGCVHACRTTTMCCR